MDNKKEFIEYIKEKIRNIESRMEKWHYENDREEGYDNGKLSAYEDILDDLENPIVKRG